MSRKDAKPEERPDMFPSGHNGIVQPFRDVPGRLSGCPFACRCLGRAAGIGHNRGEHSHRAERTGPSRRNREQQENGGIRVPPLAPGETSKEQSDTEMAGDKRGNGRIKEDGRESDHSLRQNRAQGGRKEACPWDVGPYDGGSLRHWPGPVYAPASTACSVR